MKLMFTLSTESNKSFCGSDFGCSRLQIHCSLFRCYRNNMGEGFAIVFTQFSCYCSQRADAESQYTLKT